MLYFLVPARSQSEAYAIQEAACIAKSFGTDMGIRVMESGTQRTICTVFKNGSVGLPTNESPPVQTNSKEKRIFYKIHPSSGTVACLEDFCGFRHICACHKTAGHPRSEEGFSPELRYDNGNVYCATTLRKASDANESLPDNIDQLGTGTLRLVAGQFIK